MKALYIHIPFCKYICTYCDFCKKHIKNQPVSQYIDCLIKEIKEYQIQNVNTIYVGGGTPSAVDNNLIEKLLIAINKEIDFNQILEFTWECNPDDINEELLILLKKYHVNRLSIGVQTFNDQILKEINRKYNQQEAIEAIKLAKKYFNNFSIDLMFNLPNQNVDDIKYSLEKVKEFNIPHFSYYSLILEEHTILYNQNYHNFNDDQEAEIYKMIQDFIINNMNNYNQYEISNYANENCQSQHNIHYWDLDEYYGVGLGASGYLKQIRYSNTKSIKEYMNSINNNIMPIIEKQEISISDQLEEKIFLSLRQNKKIYFEIDFINQVKKNHYLKDKLIIGSDFLKIKEKYYFVSNEIILQLLEIIENK